MIKNKYFPTLIVGAGGTGIKVCRYLQSLAEENIDKDLKKMIDMGAVQMVGIDTDQKSNEQVRLLDPKMVASSEYKAGTEEPLPTRLWRLPKNWIHLDREALNHAVSRVHEVVGLDQKNGEFVEDYPLANIRNWFPLKNEKTLDQITLGHSKLAGAAQWRPLGRMALFLNATRVYETLQNVYKEVQQADPRQGPVRAFVISSLAGGTGSGMFWDLSFFLQMIGPGTHTTGMFLLGDPFEGVDEGGRIMPNIYASLKEMATYKNWRQPLKVNYPIGKGLTFKGDTMGHRAFDMVYLYQSFPPGQDVSDRPSATIDMTCFRLAQNILAQSRRDLHAILDVGANNMDSDATAMSSSKEAGYCFSTTGTTLFPMNEVDEVEAALFQQVFDRLQPSRSENGLSLDVADLAKLFELGDHVEGGPFEPLRKEALDEAVESKPPILRRFLEQCEDGLKKLSEEDPSPAKCLRCLSEELRIKLDEAADANAVEVVLGRMDDVFIKGFETRLKAFDDSLFTKSEDFVGKKQTLTPAALKLMNRWIAHMEEDLHTYDQHAEIRISFPETYKEFRWVGEEREKAQGRGWLRGFALGLYKQVVGLDVIAISRTERLAPFFNELKQNLEQAGVGQRGSVEPILNKIWNQHRDKWRGYLQKMVDAAQTNRRQEDQRVIHEADIQDAFLSQMPENPKDITNADLQDFLNLLIPPQSHGSADINWIEEQFKDLYFKLENACGDQLTCDGEPMLVRHSLSGTFADLIRAYQKEWRTEKRSLSLDPLCDFVFCILGGRQPRSGQEAETMISHARKLVHAIVSYWNAKGNLILQKAGGEKGLRERLFRCRSKLFSSGIIENPINKKHLIVMPHSLDSDEFSEEDRRKIESTFDILAQEVMHTRSTVVVDKTDNPIIFYNDLFRSAEEISRIRDYFNAYSRFGKNGNATFYHIHRDMAALPEVVGEAINIQPVLCGNRGCNKNLRNVPRTENICPGCRKPIWNRCGNPGCSEDELAERIHGNKDEMGKPRVPFECPVCTEDLKNYWWRCDDPCHLKKIPADKETCPQCLVEYQQNKRVHQDIFSRPDLRMLVCPGCLRIEDEDDHRTRIAWPLRGYYFDGVNGHDSIYFQKLIDSFKNDSRYKVNRHLCPNSAQEHFVFPTCPKSADDPNHHHHLYRNEKGRFGCTKHPELKFYECHYCKYPVMESDRECGGCPRCLRPVRKCQWCSEKYGYLYEPLPGSSPERCPHCSNPMALENDFNREMLESGLKEAAFCANIYGCKAGSRPWIAAAEYDNGHCRVCPDPASPLLPREKLETIIDDCPLCSLVLHPDLTDPGSEYPSKKGIGPRFAEKFRENKGSLNRDCLICGAKPINVIAWMNRDGEVFGALSSPHALSPDEQAEDTKVSSPSDLQTLKEAIDKRRGAELPKENFESALSLLTALRLYQDDRQAFSAIKKGMELHELLETDQAKLDSIVQIFPRGSHFAVVLRRRLNGIWKFQKELLDRTRGWLSKPDSHK